MIQVDDKEQIRRAFFLDNKSQRQIACEHSSHRVLIIRDVRLRRHWPTPIPVPMNNAPRAPHQCSNLTNRS